jgi:hypothetical protein
MVQQIVFVVPICSDAWRLYFQAMLTSPDLNLQNFICKVILKVLGIAQQLIMDVGKLQWTEDRCEIISNMTGAFERM